MSNQRFTPAFKDEAVRQVIERGYSVAEVSERLGVSARPSSVLATQTVWGRNHERGARRS